MPGLSANHGRCQQKKNKPMCHTINVCAAVKPSQLTDGCDSISHKFIGNSVLFFARRPQFDELKCVCEWVTV